MKKKLPDGRTIEISDKAGSISGKNKRTGQFELKSIPKENKFTGEKLSAKELKKRLENGE